MWGGGGGGGGGGSALKKAPMTILLHGVWVINIFWLRIKQFSLEVYVYITNSISLSYLFKIRLSKEP